MQKSEEEIVKVTLNLYAKDKADLERIYGRGWTELVRNLVRKHLKQREGSWETQSTI